MSGAARLSSADHALIHAVGWLVCNVIGDDPTVPMLEAVLRELLPAVNRGHPGVAGCAAGAEAMLAARTGRDRCAARRLARDSMLEFHLSRAGEALDVFRKGSANA